jgi:uncharacterized protein YdiU (UPF0061 family)
MKFENTYTTLPERFYERVKPQGFSSPKLLLLNMDLATELGINLDSYSSEELAMIFSGQDLLPGSDPIAMAYAGFQFGHPVPQLGDGRAHLLGEINGYDIQLKGSGRTKFSRNGDGLSALGPVIREYIVSEAMHALGVPTTRALCAVVTGERVLRQNGIEPGGVFTRVADSHLRVGTFQYFAFRKDLEAIELLIDYTIERHYRELKSLSTMKQKCLGLLKELIKKQALLVGKWSALGFIHGVMNTDNFSIAGITIDYGPCAFMDEFKFDKVFSSIDRNGRYSYFNQIPIAGWNVLRLADCLLPFIDEDGEKAMVIVEEELKELMQLFHSERLKLLASKFGIEDYQHEDEALIMEFLEYLEENALDFTLSFRDLKKLFYGESQHVQNDAKLDTWIHKWKDRVDKVDHLDKVNPLYIPRNHQVEKAIRLAYEGDYSHFKLMNKVLKHPFSKQDDADDLIKAPMPDQRVYQTFCGT